MVLPTSAPDTSHGQVEEFPARRLGRYRNVPAYPSPLHWADDGRICFFSGPDLTIIQPEHNLSHETTTLSSDPTSCCFPHKNFELGNPPQDADTGSKWIPTNTDVVEGNLGEEDVPVVIRSALVTPRTGLFPGSIKDDPAFWSATAWSPLGCGIDRGCLLAAVTSHHEVLVYDSTPTGRDFSWRQTASVSAALRAYLDTGKGRPLTAEEQEYNQQLQQQQGQPALAQPPLDTRGVRKSVWRWKSKGIATMAVAWSNRVTEPPEQGAAVSPAAAAPAAAGGDVGGGGGNTDSMGNGFGLHGEARGRGRRRRRSVLLATGGKSLLCVWRLCTPPTAEGGNAMKLDVEPTCVFQATEVRSLAWSSDPRGASSGGEQSVLAVGLLSGSVMLYRVGLEEGRMTPSREVCPADGTPATLLSWLHHSCYATLGCRGVLAIAKGPRLLLHTSHTTTSEQAVGAEAGAGEEPGGGVGTETVDCLDEVIGHSNDISSLCASEGLDGEEGGVRVFSACLDGDVREWTISPKQSGSGLHAASTGGGALCASAIPDIGGGGANEDGSGSGVAPVSFSSREGRLVFQTRDGSAVLGCGVSPHGILLALAIFQPPDPKASKVSSADYTIRTTHSCIFIADLLDPSLRMGREDNDDKEGEVDEDEDEHVIMYDSVEHYEGTRTSTSRSSSSAERLVSGILSRPNGKTLLTDVLWLVQLSGFLAGAEVGVREWMVQGVHPPDLERIRKAMATVLSKQQQGETLAGASSSTFGATDRILAMSHGALCSLLAGYTAAKARLLEGGRGSSDRLTLPQATQLKLYTEMELMATRMAIRVRWVMRRLRALLGHHGQGQGVAEEGAMPPEARQSASIMLLFLEAVQGIDPGRRSRGKEYSCVPQAELTDVVSRTRIMLQQEGALGPAPAGGPAPGGGGVAFPERCIACQLPLRVKLDVVASPPYSSSSPALQQANVESSVFVDPSSATCSKGHTTARCARTLLLSTGMQFRRCGMCEQVASVSRRLTRGSSSWLRESLDQAAVCLYCNVLMDHSSLESNDLAVDDGGATGRRGYR